MRSNRIVKPIHWFRKLVATVLLLGCILFIWGNSMLSPEDSSRLSKMVATFVTRVLHLVMDDNHPIARYLLQNIRKVAHAIEFFVLGSVSVLILKVLERASFSMVLHAVLLLLFVAVTDESIQMFTGRGAQVSDILLDFSGGMAGLCLSFFVASVGKALFSPIK